MTCVRRANEDRWRGRIVAVVFALAFLTGCGGGAEDLTPGDDDGPRPVNTPVPSTPTPGPSTPTPSPEPGAPAAIRFVRAEPTAIGVHGSGLQEQSTLTFQVTDAQGTPVGGVLVNFTLNAVGGESISPAQRATDASGNVSVTLTSGTQGAVAVQITAQVEGFPNVVTQSTGVAIFGGLPVQSRFGMAAERLNVAGRVRFGIQDRISVYANDRVGNAVPPGTVISFSSNGASVVGQTATDVNGIATAQLQTENNIPPTGIVMVLAYTRGEEGFVDTNGNDRFDPGTDTLTGDDEPEPFIDFRPLPVDLAPTPPNDAACPVAPPSWLCNQRYDSGVPFERFIDADQDGVWDTQGTSGQWDNNILIFDSFPVTFSGPLVTPVLTPATFTIFEGGAQGFTLEVHDDLLNPLVGGSTITVTSSSDKVTVTPETQIIPDGQSFNQIIDGLTRFFFVVSDATDDENPIAGPAFITVTITSENGSGSFILASGEVNVRRSTPTPTITPTPTATALAPVIVPTQAVLTVGTGAPPNSCNGGTQTFVVTGGSPPFSVFGGGGCVSAPSVPTSGGSFTYTAGQIVGAYAITVSDALGRTASINVTVQEPATPTPMQTPTFTLTSAPTLTPTPGAPAALRFLGADRFAIGVRGSGLPVQSTLTFQVTDARSAPVSGVLVNFSVMPVADETIAPDRAVTDINGNVSVTLTSGQRALSVQITAQVNSVTPALIVRSTPVDILGAPPSQIHFSLAHEFHNISGQVTFGLTNEIRAFVGDRFGNPVPAGTAVSFTTTGGVIGSPVATDDLGQAVGTLVSQEPIPAGGIVDTLATTHGEREFDDANNNGICDPGEALEAVSEPYYDANCNTVYDADEDFIDLNGDHVFDADQGNGARACSDSVVIFKNICTTFSGGTIVELIPSQPGPLPAGGVREYTLIITDSDGNPIVGGSNVSITVQGRIKLLGPSSFDLADAQTFNQLVGGINSFQFSITDNAPASTTGQTDALIVSVTSDPPASLPAGGNGSVIVTDLVTFLPAGVGTPPAATPTPGTPSAMRFVGTDTSVIGVRGSGLPQQAQLTFQVTDTRGAPVQGVLVSFSVAPVADESIAPTQAVTDANGNVQVTLTSGQRALSVQVTAQVNGVTPPLSVRSTPVDILGAQPSPLHFSLAHQFHNISGRVTFGLTDEIRAFVADRFGNPVPPGTAVSFTTIGGVIGSPVTTNELGQAVGTLVSQNPLPPGGIVSTLATTHGERAFADTNHNGVCDAGEALGAVSEPYYDTNCNEVYDQGETFIDLNGNQVFDPDQGGGTRACSDSIVVFESICTTFSAPTIVELIASSQGPIPAGGTRDYTLIIRDADANSIVGGSTVSIVVQGRIKLLGPGGFVIADAQTLNHLVDGINRFHFAITDNAPASPTGETAAVIVTVASNPQSLPAGGNGSVIVTDIVQFLAAPTPIPSGNNDGTVRVAD